MNIQTATIGKISKWGNGFGLRLPTKLVYSMSLQHDSEVLIINEKDCVKIIPKSPSIKDLTLSQIYKGANLKNIDNRNVANLFGKSLGNELW